MDPANKRYIIGIDLGTTNSAVSYVDREAEGNNIRLFHIPQIAAPGEVARNNVLPSFLYLPGKYDVNTEQLKLPWPKDPDRVAGLFAREQGAKVPGRLVASAKSWLCHSRVDRTGPILPWAADKEVQKVSPVQASAEYLAHIRHAWNHKMGDDADLYLENQFVIVTVPASFDEVARDLTMEAARLAGLGDVTLLEEPLAAFYSWLVFHEKDWEKHVAPGELICAVDVGGGTSDFTLITLREVDGHPRFERIAVGDHLILGGDNMDLALARQTEARMGKGGRSLSANRWQALCYQCRQAKEAILSGAADTQKITLMGEGSSLIGGTLTASLNREQIEQTILEGFFPVVDQGQEVQAKQKAGITEFGLPYAQDPAVTRHVCRFLERHAQDVEKLLGKEVPFPELLLFNGGSCKPNVIQEHVRQAVSHWFGEEDLPRVLQNPDLDLAVSRGAAYYGLVKAGEGVRVGSGSARGYYLGVAEKGEAQPQSALCLVERGVEEGTRRELAGRDFQVLANQPVHFQVYSSSFRSGDTGGDVVPIDDTLTRLAPIKTVIQYGKKGTQAAIPVHMESLYTELGSLELWCKSQKSDHRWRLQFQTRDAGALAEEVAETQVLEESTIQEVLSLLDKVFAKKAADPPPERLANAISDAVEMSRDNWPLSLLRTMADDLLKKEKGKKIGAEHEARWLNLAGFCLRPGFGDALDEHRVGKLWSQYKKGMIHANNPQVRKEWWILWRRVAGGLSAGRQRQLFQDMLPMLRPKKGGGPKIPPQEMAEIWMLLANLERLLVKDKVEMASLLTKSLHPKKTKATMLWTLSRLGEREPLYGPLDRVTAPEDAWKWIRKLMEVSWKNPKAAAQSAARMGRKTGDRKRDLDQEHADQLIAWLSPHDWSGPLVEKVTNVREVSAKDRDEQFGEALPAGIVMQGE